MSVKDSSPPIPVTGLFWQCWEEWDQKTLICERPGPTKKKTKLSGTQSQGLQQRDREAPQESRWHRGKADAKNRHYGHGVFVAAFSPSTGCFQSVIMTSLSREAASKLLLAVVWQGLWRWAGSYKPWLPPALLVFIRNMGRMWLGYPETSKCWGSRLCGLHFIKMKAWTGFGLGTMKQWRLGKGFISRAKRGIKQDALLWCSQACSTPQCGNVWK